MLEGFVEFDFDNSIKMFVARNPPICTAVRFVATPQGVGDILNLFEGHADYSLGRRDYFVEPENALGFKIDESGGCPMLYFDEKNTSSRLIGKITDLEKARRWIEKANKNYPYSDSTSPAMSSH
jgi:hypothetical protein